jgi:hypothetical protein
MNATDRVRTERPLENPAPQGSWVPSPDETDHARELHRPAGRLCERPGVEVPRDDAALFTLLDELARGLEREQALSPPARAARAPQILAWFAPRYAALRAAAAAAPLRRALVDLAGRPGGRLGRPRAASLPGSASPGGIARGSARGPARGQTSREPREAPSGLATSPAFRTTPRRRSEQRRHDARRDPRGAPPDPARRRHPPGSAPAAGVWAGQWEDPDPDPPDPVADPARGPSRRRDPRPHVLAGPPRTSCAAGSPGASARRHGSCGPGRSTGSAPGSCAVTPRHWVERPPSRSSTARTLAG